MYERFTDRARRVMQLGHQEAWRLGHEYLGTEHLLLGLVKEESGVAARVLKNAGVELGKVRDAVVQIVRPACHDRGPVVLGRLPHTPRLKEVIAYSAEEAGNLNHDCVGTEHLLLGLLRLPENLASVILQNLGVDSGALRAEVLEMLGQTVAERSAAEPAPADTVRVVREGFEPPVVEFQSLPLGSTFLNLHGVWRKVQPFHYRVDGGPTIHANAVGLSGGVVAIATPDDPVTPVECTLTVRPKAAGSR
jgi:ATP-dependent Clp protease ATP-binding subunit ClpA